MEKVEKVSTDEVGDGHILEKNICAYEGGSYELLAM